MSKTDTNYDLYRVARPNGTPMYGWGWEHEAQQWADELDAREGLEVDLYTVLIVTDPDEIDAAGEDADLIEAELDHLRNICYRACFWVASDRQGEVVLTIREQSDLPDDELLVIAERNAAEVGMDLSGGSLEIGYWYE